MRNCLYALVGAVVVLTGGLRGRRNNRCKEPLAAPTWGSMWGGDGCTVADYYVNESDFVLGR